jgi:hypothetical protein
VGGQARDDGLFPLRDPASMAAASRKPALSPITPSPVFFARLCTISGRGVFGHWGARLARPL